MKAKILILCSMLLLLFSFGRSQPINTWVKDVVQQAPNAAALFKYTDVPVDYSSGLPSIGIPIHAFQHGPIPVNVSLSYHAQGVRVAENASWVGLGWNLNAGGQITRTTLGEPDESAYGYYNGGYMVGPDPNGNACPNCQWFNGLACGLLTSGTSWGTSNYPYVPSDLEPDIFSYSFEGYSGKFIIDKDHTVRLIDPSNDVKVSYTFNNGFESFTILTPTGIKYIFGKYGITTAYEDTKAGASVNFWRSSWMLLRAESYDLKYAVTYNYANETYSYKTPSSGQFVRSNIVPNVLSYPGANGYDTPKHWYTIHYIAGKRLTSITTPLETITFDAATPRQDLDPNSGTIVTVNRLDNISITTGSFCKKFTLNYDYTQDGTSTFSYHKRLLLLSVQEKSCNGTITNPAYSFTYNGNYVNGKLFLPNRLSKAVDHWGFYNGESLNENLDLNIPSTTVSLTGPPATTYTYGSANRESNQTYMLYGALKRITYPTGGYTEFEMEANVAYKQSNAVSNTYLINGLSTCAGSPTQACCGYIIVQQNITFTSIDQINTTKFNLSAVKPSASGNGDCLGAYETYAKVEIYQGSIFKGSYSLNLASNQPSATANNKNLSEFSAFLTTGVAYTFRLKSANCKGTFDLYYPTTSSQFTNYNVGGLRVKKITTHDGFDPNKNIIRTYSYENPSTPSLSSGKLINLPQYVAAASYIRRAPYDISEYIVEARFKDYSQTPLSSFDGRHILYRDVRESVAGQGSTSYLFDAVGATNGTDVIYTGDASSVVGVPYIVLYEPRNGKLLEKVVKNSSGVTILTETFNYENNYTFAPGYAVKKENFICQSLVTTPDPLNYPPREGTKAYIANLYQIRIGKSLLKTHSITLDGVNTLTTNTYHPTYLHHQPISTAITNSDGKIHKTNYKYIYDLTSSPVTTKLLEYNLLIPAIETVALVGTTQVGGSKFNYSLFTTTGAPTITLATGYYPYPYQYYNYEVTFNSSGTSQPGEAWVLAATVNAMNMSIARPATFTVANWQAETYEWETYGRLKKRKFGVFEWNYTYHPNTRMVNTITDIDGQVVTYSYDALMRLSQGAARNNNINTYYTYQYKDAASAYNYVNTRTTYTATTNSALTERETRQYLDGLGRVIQTVDKKYSPNQKDVIKAVEYDNQGRPFKVFEPFETANTTAAYATVPTTTKFTLTQYENSPLSRTIAVTPPSWYATTTAYGANTANEVPTTPNGTTYYPINSLIKTTVADPMGNKTITYVDKIGRLIATKKTNAAGDPLTALTTYNVYDVKSRLVKVVPPGSTATSTTLNYEYTYDGKNNILTKKVPDQNLMSYKYNSRDLLTFVQDGNLQTANQWTNTQYDTYGRVTKTAIYTNSNSFNGDIVPTTLTTILTENTYGTTGIELGKLKTSKSKILGTTLDLSTTYAYDVYGRIGSINGNNHLNLTLGSETHAFAYDFADNIMTDTRVHKPSSTQTYNIAERWTYDHVGRAKDYFHTLNGVETHIANTNYSIKDQIAERNIGKVTSPVATWLQSIDYAYNDMGWLTMINSNALTGTNLPFQTICNPVLPQPGSYSAQANPDSNDLFYMEFRHDVPFSSTSGAISGMPSTNIQKSGNIAQMAWRVKGRDRQSYDFTYDYLNRLTSATYYDVNSTNTASATNRFNETLTYDVRGNINTLTRTGFYQNGSICGYNTIDQLTYGYTASTNKLATVADAAPTTNNQRTQGFNPGSGGVGYTYDNNGNLKTDSYKGITTILYNHLNLPTSIQWGTSKKIDFQYDASGVQLSRTVYTGTTINYRQDYVAGVEYRTVGATRKLESIAHAEGRRYNTNVNTASTAEALRLEYAIRDHLGNTRIMFTDKNNNGVIDVYKAELDNEIILENHYYPFGMTFGGNVWMNDATDIDHRYQYNSKELNNDHGLGWYNYGARFYDAVLGRFTSADPLSATTPRWTPYRYGFNNPLIMIDPTGMTERFYSDQYGTHHAVTSSIQGGYSVYSDGVQSSKNDHIVAQNASEAQNLADDLNTIFKNVYGFSNAFYVQKSAIKEKMKNPKYSVFTSWWTGEPQYVEVEKERIFIKTNNEFNWNTDEYTAAMFDVANTTSNIFVDIVANNGVNAAKAVGGILGSGLLESYGGGFTVNSNHVVLSDKLAKTTGSSYSWTLGAVAMHELLYHIHYLGANEGDPNKMRRRIGQMTGGRHGAGGNQNSTIIAEKERLNALRNKTGK